MNEVFLGIIAASVAVMAAIQVALVIYAGRVAGRMERLATQLEEDIRPLVENLRAMSADAARAASLAAAQAERADRLFGEFAERVDRTLATVQDTLMAPAREGFAVLSGLKAALSAFRDLRETRKRPVAVDDEDALFIG